MKPQKNILLFVTMLVTFKLYAVAIMTLEMHNPPRSLSLQSQQSQADQPRLLLNHK
ncbi:hypothetical protein J9317_03820 [Metabacillus sp. KIGAM252]|uniref:Phosphatase n=1 Tax=Metabacillus flavus TaxID=2823519 RepID=A0ABS5LAZ4_9BACI|nr:hypothetical protein [Metabacillus flavus]MBS2967903.1 hypothetical protein [Metabacillus flavus]